ncbi:MAG TPA: SPOR domain-containing protein [Myxococcaceae bacterium]|nr:SPOR domain-containing protein [Myxococcaceae bacterium]
MRDDHRIKEKYELSLDNRQVASFFIAAIVVVGTVFVLGVVVGKKLASSRGAANAADLLSALDEKAAAMEQVRAAPPSEPRLTFQDELTKKSESPPSKEPVAAEIRPEVKKSAGAENAEPSPEPPREKPSRAMPQTEKPPQVAARSGSFTLQLSASQVRADADRFAARLREKGYQPYIVESDVKDRGRWYRVRMGTFSSKEAAAKYLADFRRETQLQAFVTSAN